MANIFITGATGLIGSFVVEKLDERKHQISCLVRKSSNLQWIKDAPVNCIVGSLAEPHSFLEAVRKADYIFHIAGVTKALNRDDYFRGNVVATKNLLETVKRVGTSVRRFLLVSSQAAVGPSPSALLIDEDFPCHPITDYGKSKLEGEEITKKYRENIPITIVRPPSVFGPRDTDVFQFFRSIHKGFNLQIGGVDQLVSTVYVEDLAVGIIQTAFSEKTIGETYFLCEEIPHLWSQVAKVTSEVLCKKFVTISIPYKLALFLSYHIEMISKIRNKPFILNQQKVREVVQPFWTLSVEKAKRDVGYSTSYPLRKAIERTITWYQNMNWL